MWLTTLIAIPLLSMSAMRASCAALELDNFHFRRRPQGSSAFAAMMKLFSPAAARLSIHFLGSHVPCHGFHVRCMASARTTAKRSWLMFVCLSVVAMFVAALRIPDGPRGRVVLRVASICFKVAVISACFVARAARFIIFVVVHILNIAVPR